MIHPLAWVAWLAATAVALLATRNPLYIGLILLCIAAVWHVLRPRSKAPPLPLSPLRFGLLIVLASAAFNALTSHFGETVLFMLPSSWPLVGGPITLEALAFGAINGLVLAGFLAAFTVLNMALPTHALMRLIPRAFAPLAVVLSIAAAFVPATLRQLQQVSEAQAVRGHQVRGVRGWLPLAMPLLVGGLERAFQLAEAMTARGFTAGPQATPAYGIQRQQAGIRATAASLPAWLPRVLLLIGLLVVLSGLLVRLAWGHPLGTGMVVAAGALMVVALWLAGQRVQRTTYRPQPWEQAAWAVLAGAAVVLAGYLLPVPGQAALYYTPYPRIAWPDFNAALGVITLGLATPALVLLLSKNLEAS